MTVPGTLTRRTFLATALAVTTASRRSAGVAQGGRTRLILLGAGRGRERRAPGPRRWSSATIITTEW